MSLEISIITNNKLQKIANKVDSNKNGYLDKSEIFNFTKEVNSSGDTTLKDDFKAAMQLYFMSENAQQPKDNNAEGVAGAENGAENGAAGETNAGSATTKKAAPEKETKEQKTQRESKENFIDGTIHEWIKNEKVTPSRNGETTLENITLDNLVETLREIYGHEDYRSVIDEVQKLIEYANSCGLNSKSEIDNLEKKLKKMDGVTRFQKNIADSIVDLAKEKQVQKEAKVLKEIYDALVNNMKKDETKNYSTLLEKVKEEAKKRNLDCSYYLTDAFKVLQGAVAMDVENDVRAKLGNMNHIELSAKIAVVKGEHLVNKSVRDKSKNNNKYNIDFSKDITEADLKKYLVTLYPNDKFAEKVINNMKDLLRTVTNNQNIAKTRDLKLKTLTEADLKTELGNDLYHKLKACGFLDTCVVPNTNPQQYDLSEVSVLLQAAVGADGEKDPYGDPKMSEAYGAIQILEDKFNNGDITEDNLNKLMKLCNIPDAPKSRDFKDIFANARNDAIAGGVIGGILGSINITAQVGAKALAEAGITTAVAGAGVSVMVSLAPAYATAVAPIALDALLNLIIGVEKKEQTCFDYKEAEGKTIQEYIEKVAKDEKGEKAQAIAVLAKMYHQAYGEEWNTKFVEDMKIAAGNDALKCLELEAAWKEITDKLIDKIKKNEEASKEVVTEPKQEVKDQQDSITTVGPVTHDWEKYRYSWQAIIYAYYPDLFEGKSKEDIYHMMNALTDIFRKEHKIGKREGLPKETAYVLKPINYNGQTYYPKAADSKRIEDAASKEWFGYKSSWYAGTWEWSTQGNASNKEDQVYTATRTSDGKTNSNKNQEEAQNYLIPEGKDGIRQIVDISNVDGTTRRVVVEPIDKTQK